MKKWLGFFCFLFLVVGFSSCAKHPQEPLLVKISTINLNRVQYDRNLVAVKGRVTAIDVQPAQQTGWYNITDDTDVITVRTASSDMPKLGDELWVSGTYLSNDDVIQERQKVSLNAFPWIFVIVGGVVLLVIILLLVLLLKPKNKTQYQPVGGAYPSARPVPPPPPPSYSPHPTPPPPPPPPPQKSSATMMDAPKPQKGASETFIAEDSAEPVLAYLIVKSGTRTGTNYPLKKSIIKIGRDQGNDIIIDDKKSSREHAKLKMEDGKFVLYDLASSNGTYVNGVKIQNQSIMDSDEIQIGDSVLVFKKV